MTGENKEPVTSVTADKTTGVITVMPPKAGDTTVIGTGAVGDTITIKDEIGITLGTGTVGQDGNYTVELKRPLVVGETITVTSEKSGEKTVTVSERDNAISTALPMTGAGSNTSSGSGFSTGSSYAPSTSYSKSLPSTNEKVSIAAITGALAIMASFALAVFSR